MKKLITAGLVTLTILMVATVGIVLANHEKLDVCCPWNSNLADGDLTYTIDGGTQLDRDTIDAALLDWTAVSGLSFSAPLGGAKPDIKIRIKGGGGMIAGQALRHFDTSGFIKSVSLSISGKAFGLPNSQPIIAQIVRHEVGHAVGLGHASFDGDLMAPVLGAADSISTCDINGVLAANHWALVDALGTSPHQPHQTSVDCSTTSAPATDVIVTGITASPNPATQGDRVDIIVGVANDGENSETFNVTLTLNPGGLSATTSVTLASGQSRNVGFFWQTTSETAPDDYTLEASHNLADGDNSNDSALVIVTVNEFTEEEDGGGPPPCKGPNRTDPGC